MKFVELEEARAARGLRLVVMAGVPSPWSEGAKGCLDMKGIDYLAVRLRPGDEAVRAWTGHHNAPVALYEDEPPRAGWAEILALAERLAPERTSLPADPRARVEALGLAHEVLGEGGLAWSARLALIHTSFVTEGARGFPLRAARYLAPRYGYATAYAIERAAKARARVLSLLAFLAQRLGDRPYFHDDRPTAVDVYVAVSMALFHPLPESVCAMLAPMRQAFETTDAEIREAVSPSLLALRDRMYERHLKLPVLL